VIFFHLNGAVKGRGRFELETTLVWTFRAGRAVSIQVYQDRSEALKAAGLRE
jgi:ketosteroid isomerase-like protein